MGKAKRGVGQMHLISRWETSREPTLQMAKSGKALESSRLTKTTKETKWIY